MLILSKCRYYSRGILGVIREEFGNVRQSCSLWARHTASARTTTAWCKYTALPAKTYPAIGYQILMEFMDDEKDE